MMRAIFGAKQIMKITLSNQIEIQATLDIEQQIIEQFTFANPKYKDALSFGRSTHGIDRYIYLAEQSEDGLIAPMGILDYLVQTFSPEIIDQRTEVPVTIPFAGTLRPYQDAFIDDAVYANEPSILAGIGLNNGGYGEDRYQWLIEQRKKTLGTVNYDFLEWSKNREYADKIHPLLHKVTSKESLDIIQACLTEIQFGGFRRAFGNAEVQNHKEQEAGNAFRQWWSIRESSPDAKTILEEVLGVELDKLLNLGIEQKECHKLLGIAGDATKHEINQAYRQLAKVHHPDKGGDAEMMKKLNRAKAEALAA